MQIRQRGNPDAMKAIAKASKSVSKQKGFVQEQVPVPAMPSEGGAFASMQSRQRAAVPQLPQDIISAFSSQSEAVTPQSTIVAPQSASVAETVIRPGMLYSRIYESIETVGQTKEYFNATSSLFTLYAMGQLNENVLRTLSSEDLREVKGIVREFKGILDSY